MAWLRECEEGGCVVINITRDQHVAHVVFEGEFADASDRLQPRQLQRPHRCIIDEAEDFAYLPVGGMDEAECHNATSVVVGFDTK